MSAQADLPAGVDIRPMRPADLDAVIEIEERNYLFPWTRGIFSDCLMADYHCLVLEVAGAVSGYAILSSAAAEAHILNLCVAPELHRCGYGSRLLGSLLRHVESIEVQRLFLEVRPSNTAAVSLYRKFGFQQLGLRRAYYQSGAGQREDALVLVREFN